MTKTINLQEYTYRRLVTVLDEITHSRKRDITIDDAINELIDTYQQNSWTNYGVGAGGG